MSASIKYVLGFIQKEEKSSTSNDRTKENCFKEIKKEKIKSLK